MSLVVRDLTASYEGLAVLHGVSLQVDPGEIVAMVGANGAGKTTVLRAVSGLLQPTGGSVHLDDREITRLGAERISALGLAHVPENRLVFPSLSVEDNLQLGGWNRKRDKRYAERRAAALELFPRLADRIALQAGALSGGEQQMLAMARGLMADPSVIVLDEPSLGLAPKVVGEIVAALAHLRDDRNLAVLLVEQNIRAAFSVADRAVVMERGRVLVEGTVEQLRDDPRVQAAYLGGSATTMPEDNVRRVATAVARYDHEVHDPAAGPSPGDPR
ncbi:ABC transporter ATP-binding protein [Ornithinimicrobium cerasi]|uniref:Amino acid/amide ABC transporter ATP-binding protein 2, HAAT family n=1 Tax=Ornithinimicrobium cerasi TaxID=2248773 RepID=A0A285VTI8_9MICO|nr:ABC transporter ATP-binding protein [Ornithinimicrobium cerasi]SOC56898.1 amino acid/amide ABC transporter ATP-binding protein 2, HAAT family [Ornithinimicrobium cerasi]